MKIKINRIHFAEVDNIEKIVETKCCILVYLKSGYPKILKANCSKSQLLLRMVNVNASSEKIMEIRNA